MQSLDDDSLTIEHEPIVLVPALEQLVRDLPGGDRVELRVSADAPPTIESDALRLGQVVTNLLTNALKYSGEGVGVTVEVEPVGTHGIGIAVIDHGIGIEPEERARVFEPFYRTAEGARSGSPSAPPRDRCRRPSP